MNIRLSIATTLMSIVLLLACAQSPQTEGPPRAAATGGPAETCQLTILNGSGATLLKSNQVVYEFNRPIVELPRLTYKSIAIPAGLHEFRYFKGGFGTRGLAKLNAKPRSVYYLYVEYSPARSWGFPFGGWPERLEVISEEDAQSRMKAMKPAAELGSTGK